jgi:hypothetical protein
MAIGPGPDDSTRSLYLGDIGDNGAQRPEIVVYRVVEPRVAGVAAEALSITDVERLTLRYPDRPHDAEVLLVDPVSRDLFIVTKEGGNSLVFRAPGPALQADAAITLEQAGRIDFSQLTSESVIPSDAPPLARGGGQLATAGDISPSGSAIAIRTYSTVWVWPRADGQSVADALAGPPCEAPAAIEPQGESIAFTADGLGFVTISEGANPLINRTFSE